jgi:hypothetical protein
MSLKNRYQRQGKVENWIFLVFVVALLGSVSIYFPPFWTAWKMKKIVKDAALTYEVTGSANSAEQKLYSGMKKEHIPLYIEDRDCSLRESSSLFSVECIWFAPITIDIPGAPIDLSREFSVYTSINRSGVIDQR